MNTENRVSFSVSGVIYGGAVIALTAASIILISHGYFRAGHISNVVAIMISVFIGVSVSVAGFVLWLSTVQIPVKENAYSGCGERYSGIRGMDQY